MMVCFVSPYSPRNISGISVLLARMAERLEEKGHEPLLIAPMSFTSSKKPIFFRPEKNLFEIEIKTGLLKNLYLAIATILRILKLRRRIDIIHLHQPHMQCFLSAVMGRAIGKPVIVTYHLKLARAAGGLKYAQQTVLEKLVAKFSNKLIYVSERTRDEYNLSGIVIRNGVDIDRFNSDVRTKVEARNRFGIGAKYFAILFAGRWTEDKGIFEVLESVSKLKKRHNDWKLLLVGGGDESNTNKVCNAIERLGI